MPRHASLDKVNELSAALTMTCAAAAVTLLPASRVLVAVRPKPSETAANEARILLSYAKIPRSPPPPPPAAAAAAAAAMRAQAGPMVWLWATAGG